MIIQLVNQILDSFNEDKFALGLFIDLNKAFDTGDHTIPLKILESDGITSDNLKWLQNYLSNRKQLIRLNYQNTSLEKIQCGVPQGFLY